MADLQFQVPVTEEVEVDEGTLAAIDRGIHDADAGRAIPIGELRNMIPVAFQIRITEAALAHEKPRFGY